MKSVIPGVSAGMALLISPDHLRLWGNLAGQMGLAFWIAAFGAGIVYALSAQGYRRLAAHQLGGGYLTGWRSGGGIACLSLALASRLALTTGMATGVLVTTGYVFNETFIHWFPNFGFSFLCLACTALLLAWGYAPAERVQAALLAVAVLGLSLLVIVGFVNSPTNPVAGAWVIPGFNAPMLAGGLLLFVGFDLGVHRNAPSDRAAMDIRMMPATLGVAVLLFGLWSVVSLAHVPAQRLSGSDIPFTLAARAVSGQTGRIVMGTVVIAGSCAAVIALFAATSRMVGTLSQMKLLPGCFGGSTRRNAPAAVLLTATIAAMLALGFAGSPNLEIFIRAGVLLWLLHLCLVHPISRHTRNRRATGGPLPPSALPERLATVLMGIGGSVLWMADADRMHVLVYFLAIWAAMTAVLWISNRTARKAPPPNPRQTAAERS